MHASRPMQNLGGYPLRDRLRGEGLKAGGALFIVSGPPEAVCEAQI